MSYRKPYSYQDIFPPPRQLRPWWSAGQIGGAVFPGLRSQPLEPGAIFLTVSNLG
jgi:hypothetical protein